MYWSRVEPNQHGRRQQCNVLHEVPGLTQYALRNIRDDPVLDCFKLIFDKSMVESSVVSTNCQGRYEKGDQWKLLDLQEFWAFLGLIIYRSVYQSTGESVQELRSAASGRAVFSATMSLARFTEIRRTLRFDNTATRQARLRTDKLAAVRLIVDGFNNNVKSLYKFSDNVTIDEQLYPFRGRCNYIQYMPMKPAKYGLKFWLLCDSQNYYIYSLEMYTGKNEERGMVSLGQHITLKLTEPLVDSGRNVTTDIFLLRWTALDNYVLVGLPCWALCAGTCASCLTRCAV